MRTTRYSEPSDAEFDRAMEHKLVAEDEEETQDDGDDDGGEETQEAVPTSGSAIADSTLAKCVAGVPHNWGKWKVMQKMVCMNWGAVSLIQDRQCSVCGLTQLNRQTV